MRERHQSDFSSQNNTLSDFLGLSGMAESEFQDRCLKPLGHPSKSLQNEDLRLCRSTKETSRCYWFATEPADAPVYGCPRGRVNRRGGNLLDLQNPVSPG
jgi:hypothetical protein